MKASTIKFLSLIVKENISSLVDAGASVIDSVNDWIVNNAHNVEDELEKNSTFTEEPDTQTVAIDKEKLKTLRKVYADWLAAQEFLDRCGVPDCTSKLSENYTLVGRIVELVYLAQSGSVSRELSEMLEFITSLKSSEK